MGDPIRVIMLQAVSEEMKRSNLLARVRESGAVLLPGLKELEARQQLPLLLSLQLTFPFLSNLTLFPSFLPPPELLP